MNLLAFIVLVGAIASCVIVAIVPEEVWSAVADRIRNPPPSPGERMWRDMHASWAEEDARARWHSDEDEER